MQLLSGNLPEFSPLSCLTLLCDSLKIEQQSALFVKKLLAVAVSITTDNT